MTIPPSGPIKLSGDLKRTFGGDSNPSLGEYYKDRVNLTGVPVRGTPISLGTFRSVTLNSLLEVITSTTSVTWTPILKTAKNIHVYVVGAGGSGGVASAESDPGIFGIDGTAAAAGGGAGGVGYVIYPQAYIPSAAVVRAGVGGSGSSASGENTGNAGSTGTSSSFTPEPSTLPRISAGGGRGGAAAWSSTPGNDVADTKSYQTGGGETPGGTATVTNIATIPNLVYGSFSGGSGGSARAEGSNPRGAAGGGGAPAFLVAHDNAKNGSFAGTDQAASGGKASEYSSFPNILETYLSNNGYSTARSLYSFDGSNGVLGVTGVSPGFGGGSGGVVRFNTGLVTSTSGGNGIILIVYEV